MVAGGAAVLLAAVAFLIWGPLGLGSGPPPGNGPLFMVRPPKPHGCWVLTALVVRYHVGDVRYRATYPDASVVCRGLDQSEVWAVMMQADAERPGQ